jgi:hypothetical protein
MRENPHVRFDEGRPARPLAKPVAYSTTCSRLHLLFNDLWTLGHGA